MKKILDEYMTFRAIDCKNKDALNNYERYMRRFLEGAKSKKGISETYLTSYIKKLSEEFSQTTLNVIKPLLKNFIKWYFPDYSLRFRNLDKLCKTKRAGSTYDPDQMIGEKEVMKLIEGETDLFWKVFWLVFFYGGFRPVDVIRLKRNQFTFEDDGMTIIKAHIVKNNKTFYKSIPPSVTPLIKKWFDINRSDWVFPSSREDKPIHQKTPHKRLERLSMKVLGKKINPYILRHSLATIKYNEEGLKDDDVANQMGHSASMKNVYNNLDDAKLRTRAKRVWTDKKEMPVEERKRLEKDIEDIERQLNQERERNKIARIESQKREEKAMSLMSKMKRQLEFLMEERRRKNP